MNLNKLQMRETETGLRIYYIPKANNEKIECVFCIKTPVNISGISHVIEHCVAERLMKKFDYNKMFQVTFHDNTEYQFKDLSEKNKWIELENIFTILFFSKINYEDYLYQIGNEEKPGIVYCEIADIINNPLALITKVIPSTLYENIYYKTISSGMIYNILDIKLEEMIDYYKKYYILSNCILLTNDDDVYLNIEKIISKDIYKTKVETNSPDYIKTKIQPYNMRLSYSSIDSEGLYYCSVNFPIEVSYTRQSDFFYKMESYMTFKIRDYMWPDNRRSGDIRLIDCQYNENTIVPYFSFVFASCNKIYKKDIRKVFAYVIQSLKYEDIEERDSKHKTIWNSIKANFLYGCPILDYNKEVETDYIEIREWFEFSKASLIYLNPNEHLLVKYENRLKNRQDNSKSCVCSNYKFRCLQHSNENMNSKCISFNSELYSGNEYTLINSGRISIYSYNFFVNYNICNIYFDLSCIDDLELVYVTLLAEIITQKFSSISIDGNIACFVLPICQKFNLQEYMVIKCINFEENITTIYNKITELLYCANFEEILNETILREKYDLQSELIRDINKYLFYHNAAQYNQEARRQDLLLGIGYLSFIKKEFDEVNHKNIKELIYKLRKVWGKLYKYSKQIISLYTSNNSFFANSFLEKLYYRENDLQNRKKTENLDNIFKNEGIVFPVHTNYLMFSGIIGYRELNSMVLSKIIDPILMQTLRISTRAYISNSFITNNGRIAISILRVKNIRDVINDMFSILESLEKYILNRDMFDNCKRMAIEKIKMKRETILGDSRTIHILSGQNSEFSRINDINCMTIEEGEKFIRGIKESLLNGVFSAIGNSVELSNNKDLFDTIRSI